MKKIGITGGIACGKSTVLAYIKSLGLEVVSCDDIAHEIFETDECQMWLHNRIDPDEYFKLKSRAEIRELIIADFEFKVDYENWIGPRIRAKMLASSADIIEVPLLFERGMQSLFENIWCIGCPDYLQLSRLTTRLGGTPEAKKTATKLIAMQLPLAEKKKKSNLYIDTSRSQSSWMNQVVEHLTNLVKLPQSVAPTADST